MVRSINENGNTLKSKRNVFDKKIWFPMFFGGGMGIDMVFWSIAESIMDSLSPPVGPGGTPEATATAMRIVFFLWGIHTWVIFAICGFALAFFQFRRGCPFWSIPPSTR